ncbi:MAG: hypothetical protein NTY45_08320 [Elusimicrobia bacterium]|nr:hypothetical protein [Elusimicrobiota bacterium]
MKNRKTGILNAVLTGLFTLLLTAASPVWAAAPEIINFQGKLTDPNGRAATGIVSMVFRLYTTPNGGTPVWSETQSVNLDSYGVYSVLLGEVNPLNISFSATYWLGMTVGIDNEMEPRYRIVASAYSLYSVRSGTAAWAAGADWAAIANKPAVTAQGNVFNGANQLVQLGADGKLPALDGSNLTGMQSTGLADGAVITAKLAGYAVTDAKVLLSTAAISSGKFGDDRVAITTTAVAGLGALALANAEADPLFSAHISSGIQAGDIARWNAAHGWGDHAQAGYLKVNGDGSQLTGVLSTNTVVEIAANNGTLGVGVPFYAFTPATNITLRKLTATIHVSGSAGSSTFRCGSDTDFVDVVVSGSDSIGQRVIAVSSKEITKNTEVSCKMQTSTQEDTPTVVVSLQYSPL